MAKSEKNAALVQTPGYFASSVIFLALSLASAAINYIYYPVIAHFLTPSQFGGIQVLIAILLQIGAIFSGLNLVTIYLVHKLDEEAATKAIEVLQKATMAIFVLVTVAVVLIQNSLLRFLHLDNQTYILIVGLDLITSIPFIIAFGHLQAQRHFAQAGLLQLTVVSTKLVLGALATKRLGPSGALLGISLGQVIGMLIFWVAGRFTKVKLWSHRITMSLLPPSLDELRLISPMAASVTAIFVVNVLLALFISFDIISARHFFVPHVSGIYTGASTISNAIVFCCLPLIGVLLPHLEKDDIRKSRPLVLRTGLMVIAIALCSVVFFRLFPRPLLGIFGQPYTQLSYLLWRLGILMSLVAGITLVCQVGAFYAPLKTMLITAGGLLLLIAAVVSHHHSLTNFVSAIMTVFLIILVAGVMQVVWIYRSGQRQNT